MPAEPHCPRTSENPATAQVTPHMTEGGGRVRRAGHRLAIPATVRWPSGRQPVPWHHDNQASSSFHAGDVWLMWRCKLHPWEEAAFRKSTRAMMTLCLRVPTVWMPGDT